MTTLSTKELYRLFLDCDWWRALSWKKRQSAGKCQRCPATVGLQSHHKRYRPNWFDTQWDDLEVLCSDCHEREHGMIPAGEVSDYPAIETIPALRPELPDIFRSSNPVVQDEEIAKIGRLRKGGLITNEEFLKLKVEIIGWLPFLDKPPELVVPFRAKTMKQLDWMRSRKEISRKEYHDQRKLFHPKFRKVWSWLSIWSAVHGGA